MRVTVEVVLDEEGEYLALIPGLSVVEGRGETRQEAIDDAISLASLYLECKEPEMLEFEVREGVVDAEN